MKSKVFMVAIMPIMLLTGCSNKESHPEYLEVTFKNYDASVLFYTSIKYGEDAAYQGETPTRPSDSQYDYTFSGWDKPLTNIKVDTTFIAQYTSKNAERTCTFHDDNGTVLYTTKVENGGTVEFKGDKDPSSKANQDYYYVFTGWDKALTNITKDTDFYPIFTNVYNVRSLTTYHEFKVFQNITNPDETNTNYLGRSQDFETAYFEAELIEPVSIEGTQDVQTTREISCKAAKFDYSEVDFTKLGKHDLSATWHGGTWSGKIEVVPNISELTVKSEYIVNGFDPMMDAGGTITTYEEGYATFYGQFTRYSNFDLFECNYIDDNTAIRITNEAKHIDIAYSILDSLHVTSYDYSNNESVVATYEITSEKFLPMTLEIHKSFDEEVSYVGRIKVVITNNSEDDIRVLDVFYDYNSSDKTIDLKVPFFEHELALNSEGKFVY